MLMLGAGGRRTMADHLGDAAHYNLCCSAGGDSGIVAAVRDLHRDGRAACGGNLTLKGIQGAFSVPSFHNPFGEGPRASMAQLWAR